MITMTFQKFRDTEWDEGDTVLYVVKRGPETLYVGISERGIWNRWFAPRGHMPRNIYGERFWTSHIGEAVAKHAPQSDKWIVELWSLEDCRKFFQSHNIPNISLRYAEKLMIDHLRPRLNSMSAPYPKKLFD